MRTILRWVLGWGLATMLLGAGCAGNGSSGNTVKFTGKIEAIDLGCYADGICEMTVSGHRLVFGKGWSSTEYGQLIGFDFNQHKAEEYVGKEAEVFGTVSDGEYSIAGSKDYYIKVLSGP